MAKKRKLSVDDSAGKCSTCGKKTSPGILGCQDPGCVSHIKKKKK